jgi:serine phosphatase RsbU (regulator of sigma subunit)/CHASE2 domain-containing sensor protein
MAPRPPQRLGIIRGIAVALLCWAALSALQLLGAFETPDLRLLDWRFQLRGPRPASDRIAIVEVDDATIEDYGRWPLPRDQYALLIEALAEGEAQVVGLDLLFLGTDLVDPRFDELLAHVTSIHPNVVHAITFVPGLRARAAPTSPRPEVEALLARHGLHADGVPAQEAAEVTTPEPGLLGAAGALGHVVLTVDRDGVVRRLPVFIRHEGRLFPSLALTVAALATTGHTPSVAAGARGGVRLAWEGREPLRLSVDRDGATGVDFTGDRGAFRRAYSMVDVVRWYAAHETDSLRRAFRGRIVLVGATAVAQVATDVSSTPFSPATPLLYVHASAVDSFLRGRSVGRVSPLVHLAVLGLLAILLGWLFVSLSMPWAAGLVGIAVAAVAGVDLGLFALRGWDVPPTLGLALPPLAYAAIASYRFIFLEHKSRERQKELQVAREIQRRLLPTAPPEVQGFDVAGVNLPAQEVGGDYYDWVPVADGHLVVGLGDVCGKGVAAALLMSHLRASLHAETREGAAPADIARAMHASLYRAIESGRFATFFLAAFEAGPGGGLRFCNAGHNPGLLYHAGKLEDLGATGLPLGMLEGATYEEQARAFEPGDVLVLYSDGITECGGRGELYGEERLHALALRLCEQELPAAGMVQTILDDVQAFAHGPAYDDDVTLIVVRRLAPPGPPPA